MRLVRPEVVNRPPPLPPQPNLHGLRHRKGLQCGTNTNELVITGATNEVVSGRTCSAPLDTCMFQFALGKTKALTSLTSTELGLINDQIQSNVNANTGLRNGAPVHRYSRQ